MKLVILQSSPAEGRYEQGIEVALNLAESGAEFAVLLAGDFDAACRGAPDDAVFKKKLKQLELFDLRPVRAGAEGAKCRALLEASCANLEF